MVPRGTHNKRKEATAMIKIVLEGKTITKFERFCSGNAFDWITQQGLFIEQKLYVDNDILWMCKKL